MPEADRDTGLDKEVKVLLGYTSTEAVDGSARVLLRQAWLSLDARWAIDFPSCFASDGSGALERIMG